MSRFLAIASWLFPLEQALITQWIKVRDNIVHLEKIETEYREVEKHYDQYISDEIKCKLCSLQTTIFEHRKKSVMIPDCFYHKYRKKMQEYEDNLAKKSC